MTTARMATAALGLLVLGACGGGGAAGSDPVDPGDQQAGLVSSADRCPMLLECHPKTSELANCPDPFLEFRTGSAELLPDTVGVLETLAAEIEATPTLRSLRIRGHAGTSETEDLAGQRASAVRDWLVENGVDDQTLDTSSQITERATSTYATVEVVNCRGVASEDDDDRASSFSLILF